MDLVQSLIILLAGYLLARHLCGTLLGDFRALDRPVLSSRVGRPAGGAGAFDSIRSQAKSAGVSMRRIRAFLHTFTRFAYIASRYAIAGKHSDRPPAQTDHVLTSAYHKLHCCCTRCIQEGPHPTALATWAGARSGSTRTESDQFPSPRLHNAQNCTAS